MISSVEGFIGYFDGVRRRTLNYIKTLPSDRLGWRPNESEFTARDLILHIAIAEKMFTGVFVTGRWHYDESHTSTNIDTHDQLVTTLDEIHQEALVILRTIPDSRLTEDCPTLEKTTIKAWRVLMMMVEHEVHHRSQLAMYLAMMGVEPPQIYGLGVEDVIARATG